MGPLRASGISVPIAGVFSFPGASISNGSTSSGGSDGGGGSGGAPVESPRAGLPLSITGTWPGGTTSLTSPANQAEGLTMSPLFMLGTWATAATTCGASFLSDSSCGGFACGAAAGALLGGGPGGSFTGPEGEALLGAAGEALLGPEGEALLGAAGEALLGPEGEALLGAAGDAMLGRRR